MKERLALVAVGGNSLIQDEKHRSMRDQYATARETMGHVADMIAAGWRVVITHGNGPQVGFLLRGSELARGELDPVPLDFCVADTQGAIGYMFQQELHNEFRARGIRSQAVSVVTQTVVDRQDPAFRNPSKPVGSFLSQEEAMMRKREEGWHVVEDAGRGWRRVVPSPQPLRIVEADAIRSLIDAGFVVVAAGGGGIPVVEDTAGNLTGVEAVIDKDRASSLLATLIGADMFLVTTGVEKVALGYRSGRPEWLDRLSVADARRYIAEGQFPDGSMGPKIEAILAFLDFGGRQAIITNPANICRSLKGETGTWFIR